MLRQPHHFNLFNRHHVLLGGLSALALVIMACGGELETEPSDKLTRAREVETIDRNHGEQFTNLGNTEERNINSGEPDVLVPYQVKCTVAKPCFEGEGPCTWGTCIDGLECIGYGLGPNGTDTCQRATSTTPNGDSLPGDFDYCAEHGPCFIGEGNCNKHSECLSNYCAYSSPGYYVCATAPSQPTGQHTPTEVPPYQDYLFCSVANPCYAGQGDCDANEECHAGLLCMQDRGGDFGMAADLDVCLPAPVISNMDPDYCTTKVCNNGEGDCDSNYECRNGLRCMENVGGDYGVGWDIDVCEHPPLLGSERFCDSINPCAKGQGDCDTDNDCAGNLTCVGDVGSQYGFAANIDVCLEPPSPMTEGAPWCNPNRLCGHGQGDCNTNADCKKGTYCVQNIGSKYGKANDVDVCELPEWHKNYCSSSTKCGEGQGDCDKHKDCQYGLACVENVGAQYNQSSGTDVCQAWPYPPHHKDYCNENHRCGHGEGDCDKDNQCESGLKCKNDVGLQYKVGDKKTDVCVDPKWHKPGTEYYCAPDHRCGEGHGNCHTNEDCKEGLTCVEDVGAQYGMNADYNVCLKY